MKNFLTAAALAITLAFTPAIFASTPAMAQDAALLLASMEADIEALLVENADDPAAFEAAVEAYILASADYELAGDAVISVLTNPKSDAAKLALANNPALKQAGGRGLGAAIAVIALTDPTIAANMQAKVEASGDATLIASVGEGTDTRTASIQQEQGGEGSGAGSGDSTPESDASGN